MGRIRRISGGYLGGTCEYPGVSGGCTVAMWVQRCPSGVIREWFRSGLWLVWGPWGRPWRAPWVGPKRMKIKSLAGTQATRTLQFAFYLFARALADRCQRPTRPPLLLQGPTMPDTTRAYPTRPYQAFFLSRHRHWSFASGLRSLAAGHGSAWHDTARRDG